MREGLLKQPEDGRWSSYNNFVLDKATVAACHVLHAGGAYMPPFGMYAIMAPRVAAPRAPVNSNPFDKRSRTSQNDG